jgi:hypothetical protein
MSDSRIRPYPVKEWGVVFAWIAGILLLNILLWFLTADIREDRLLQTVNRVLAEKNDPRRLRRIPDKVYRRQTLGRWYELAGGQGRAAVFSVLSWGSPSSYLAIINEAGRVEEFIPLSVHRAGVSGTTSPGILDIYKRRLESGSAAEERNGE